MPITEHWGTYDAKVEEALHKHNQGWVTQYVLFGTTGADGIFTPAVLPPDYPKGEVLVTRRWAHVVEDTVGSTAPNRPTRAQVRAREEEAYNEPISTRHTD
jgi:hypothetical protein